MSVAFYPELCHQPPNWKVTNKKEVVDGVHQSDDSYKNRASVFIR